LFAFIQHTEDGGVVSIHLSTAYRELWCVSAVTDTEYLGLDDQRVKTLPRRG